MTDKKQLSYADAGVDIDSANALVDDIKTIAKRTHRPGVMKSIGGFGALFELPLDRYKNPILVSGTDGVGTKLKLAMALKKHDTIGIDLVAMCVNDIVTLGAEPLFFLDYFATGSLKPEQAKAILTGIGRGCELSGSALIGGETAEMPGMYHGDDYDLAGFSVGIVEKNQILDGSKVAASDVLIGLASSGVHSNGFSLVRKVIDHVEAELSDTFGDSTLGETLLTPTKIYVKSVLNVMQHVDVHACAHITGGGLLENMPRVLPNHHTARINTSSWDWPEIFRWLQTRGNIATEEMYKTFNCGVGMVLAVAANDADRTIEMLREHGEQAWVLGEVTASDSETPSVEMD